MKRYIFLITGMFFLARGSLHAQGEQNIWTFGNEFTLDFNTAPPTLIDRTSPNTSLPAGIFNEQSIVVCDTNGNKLFTVRKSWAVNSDVDDIYDRNDNPIPGTALLTKSGVGSRMEQTPTIVPHPGNSNQYYIFYGRNGGLLYSLFDISLNNGLGNVVPGQHNVLVAGYNTVACEAMTTVAGCSGVWLILRERLDTGFLSYKIDRNGLNTTPVRSAPSSLPTEHFTNISQIKPSPNGKMVAAVFPQWHNQLTNTLIPGGVMLYDLEPCSGRVMNERILDMGNGYGGVCFSPDNTKLYTSQNDTILSSMQVGKLYQYDLSQSSLNDIRLSKTLLLTNPLAIEHVALCPMLYLPLTDIKIGPDGRLYLLNNYPAECGWGGPGMAFHIVHQPNNAGMASMPEINALYNSQNGMYCNNWSFNTTFLPRDIVFALSALPDTANGKVIAVAACFTDNSVLEAPDGKSCYLWDNGSTERERTVHSPGVYWVSYFEECTVTIDSYHVKFVPVPEVQTQQYGCDRDITFKVENGYEYEYELYKDGGNNKVAAGKGNAFRVNGLHEGVYQLKVIASPSCDTTLDITLTGYPKPELGVSPQDTTILYGESVTLHADGARLYTWWPVASLDTAITNAPIARPLEPTTYVVTGFNDYGCSDTAHIRVNIDYTMPDMIPNAFSPNGDGLNDIFRIAGITYQQVRTFEVYNRLGELVHAEYYSNNGWDGTYKGKPCDVGTYFYRVEIDNPSGGTRQLKGDVLLIR